MSDFFFLQIYYKIKKKSVAEKFARNLLLSI